MIEYILPIQWTKCVGYYWSKTSNTPEPTLLTLNRCLKQHSYDNWWPKPPKILRTFRSLWAHVVHVKVKGFTAAMGCCESDEENQRLVAETRSLPGHAPTRHLANVQEARLNDYSPLSGSIPVLPIISPMPIQDRTLNSFLAQSIPGSLQEASFIAPSAIEEDLERYEAVVNKVMKVCWTFLRETTSLFLASHLCVHLTRGFYLALLSFRHAV